LYYISNLHFSLSLSLTHKRKKKEERLQRLGIHTFYLQTLIQIISNLSIFFKLRCLFRLNQPLYTEDQKRGQVSTEPLKEHEIPVSQKHITY
jgi:hypothetical protein